MLDKKVYELAMKRNGTMEQQLQIDMARFDLIYCYLFEDNQKEIAKIWPMNLEERHHMRDYIKDSIEYKKDVGWGMGEKLLAEQHPYVTKANANKNYLLLKFLCEYFGYGVAEKKVSITEFEKTITAAVTSDSSYNSTQLNLWLGHFLALDKGTVDKAANYYYQAVVVDLRDANTGEVKFSPIRAEGFKRLIRLAQKYPENTVVKEHLQRAHQFLMKNKSPSALLATCTVSEKLLKERKSEDARSWYIVFIEENQGFEADLQKIVEKKSEFFCIDSEYQQVKFVYGLFKLLKKTATEAEKQQGYELIKAVATSGHIEAYFYLSEYYQEVGKIAEAAQCLLTLWLNGYHVSLDRLVILKSNNENVLPKEEWPSYLDKFYETIPKQEGQYQSDLEKLANMGNLLALNQLGKLAENQERPKAALGYYERAAALGSTEAIFRCGILLEETNLDKALDYYRQVLEKNLLDQPSWQRLSALTGKSEKAKNLLNEILPRRQNVENSNKIAELEKQLNSKEKPMSNKVAIATLLYQIGNLYYFRTGNTSDLENAANYYVKSLSQADNIGVEQELEKLSKSDNAAVKNIYGEYLLKKARPSSSSSLFNANYSKPSNKTLEEKIYGLFSSAVSLNYMPALLNLGRCYADAIGTERDETKAFTCYMKFLYATDENLSKKAAEAIGRLSSPMMRALGVELQKEKQGGLVDFNKAANLDIELYVNFVLQLADKEASIDVQIKLKLLNAADTITNLSNRLLLNKQVVDKIDHLKKENKQTLEVVAKTEEKPKTLTDVDDKSSKIEKLEARVERLEKENADLFRLIGAMQKQIEDLSKKSPGFSSVLKF